VLAGRNAPTPTDTLETPAAARQRWRCTRTRLIEGRLEDLHAVVIGHTIRRDYCPSCKKHVEPVVAAALPNAGFEYRLVRFANRRHYGLDVAFDWNIDLLRPDLRLRLSTGGLIAASQ